MKYSEIKNLLSVIQSPVERLELVMDLGRELQSVPKTAACNEITGCASWVQICRDGDKFYGQADSAMVRGILAVILAMIDGKTVTEIKKMDLIQEFSTLNINLGASR